MWKKNTTKQKQKKPPYNNYGSIMAVCKCFDGFMYSNVVFSLFVCLCNLLRVFFSVRLPVVFVAAAAAGSLQACCIPSQRNHGIDTFKPY